MIDDRDLDTLLNDALARRGEPAPFPVDVADRVMAHVEALGAVPRRDVGLRQFGRWAAAAAVFGLALTAALVWRGPSFDAFIAGFGHAVAGSAGVALKLAAPVQTLAGTLGRVGAALLGSAQSAIRPLAPFQPFAHVLLAAVAVAMLGITTFIVGRDVSRRTADQEHA